LRGPVTCGAFELATGESFMRLTMRVRLWTCELLHTDGTSTEGCNPGAGEGARGAAGKAFRLDVPRGTLAQPIHNPPSYPRRNPVWPCVWLRVAVLRAGWAWRLAECSTWNIPPITPLPGGWHGCGRLQPCLCPGACNMSATKRPSQACRPNGNPLSSILPLSAALKAGRRGRGRTLTPAFSLVTGRGGTHVSSHRSMAAAASRADWIALTTSDAPLTESPAAKTPGTLVI